MANDKNVYAVRSNSDQTEGRGFWYPVAFFTNEGEANRVNNDERFYRKYGIQGMHQPGNTERYPVFDTAEEFFAEQDAETRRQAMNKLTEEDKRVLGVK